MAMQLEERFLDDLFPEDLAEFCRDELLLPDDIWSKFEIDLPGFSDPDDLFQEFDSFSGSSDSTFNILDLDDDKEIRNHDCMWAGHCGSKEHSADEPRHTIVPAAPVPIIKAPAAPPAAAPTSSSAIVNNAATPAALPAAIPKPTAAKAQQSLLKTNIRAAQVMMNSHTPQTPPMSDDEDCKAKISKLPLIYHTQQHDSHIDDDSDLREYFKEEVVNEEISIKEEVMDEEDDEEEDDTEEEADDKDEEEEAEQEQKPDIKSFQFAATIDHSYFKDKNASMHMNSLGIDTPSDSEEEEIDVVSVADKYTTMTRMALPTNPSTRDRHQLQRRMATAISNKRKTMQKVPVVNTMVTRKQYLDTPAPSPIKRRMAEPRNVKRSKQYHHRIPAANSSSSSSPYKRRMNYGNSSDSEPEPSEKRSLHNNMERQRRIDLRNAFEDLRKLVPEVFKKDKAPKVVILREAAKYCNHLGNVSYHHNRQMEELKKRQEWLRQRVSQLRRNLAAKR